MRKRSIAVAILSVALTCLNSHAADPPGIARAMPPDVFLFVSERYNQERDFLRAYWAEVFEALLQSGIGDDVFGLIAGFMDEPQRSEMERLKARLMDLARVVDWNALERSPESGFAERMPQPHVSPDRSFQMGPVEMLWVARGEPSSIDSNHQALRALLDAMVEEINRLSRSQALAVESRVQGAAQVASVNLTSGAPGAPEVRICLARREDVLLIGMGHELFDEALAHLDGKRGSLADSARFREAMQPLPAAEDMVMFFDLQAMLRPLRTLMDRAMDKLSVGRDVYLNVDRGRQVRQRNNEALAAYRGGDVKRALELTQQAYAVAPDCAITLYNLACFNALLGNRDEALTWLERAVQGGFYAPGKIADDSDLDSLRSDPRYGEIQAQAVELAALHAAPDVVVNASKSGEAYRLYMEARRVYEQQQDAELALRLAEQGYTASPSDARVLYGLASFHALLGHQEQALNFLEQAVAGGFYCPAHISQSPDFAALRADERYQAALALARQRAAAAATTDAAARARAVRSVVTRIFDAVNVLEHVTMVGYTEGYSTHEVTRIGLVADASSRPIYAVIAGDAPLESFDRFLPRETLSFSVDRVGDLGALYEFIVETIRAAGPEGEQVLARWDELQAQFGVDLGRDVFSWLGRQSISVTLENDAGSAWMIQVQDEALARKNVGAFVEGFTRVVSELSARQPMLAMLSLRSSPIENDKLSGFQSVALLAAPTQPLVWGVSDGYLIVGSEAAIELCLETARGKHPGIRDNPRVQAEMLQPPPGCVGVYLSDYRKMGEEIAQVLNMISPIAGVLSATLPDPQARQALTKVGAMLSKLGNVARKINFFKASAGVTTFDGRAWLIRTVTHYQPPGGER
jgi:tetratricopeptide (TPR) repeat protein